MKKEHENKKESQLLAEIASMEKRIAVLERALELARMGISQCRLYHDDIPEPMDYYIAQASRELAEEAKEKKDGETK